VEENRGGEVHHVVWDEDLSRRAKGYLSRLGYGDMIRYHVREAVETLQGMDGEFDLVFNDINKEAYPDSLPVIYDKLKVGGVLIVDNVIWGGRVMDPANREESTNSIRAFHAMIAEDPRWIQSTVPLRDGLLVGYKR
jgi:predicted O-methyltransferase YrrM